MIAQVTKTAIAVLVTGKTPTETKFGIILTLENNTNPFELLGNCRSCR